MVRCGNGNIAVLHPSPQMCSLPQILLAPKTALPCQAHVLNQHRVISRDQLRRDVGPAACNGVLTAPVPTAGAAKQSLGPRLFALPPTVDGASINPEPNS